MRTLFLAPCLVALLPGCATVVGGMSQRVSVETRAQGAPVEGAACTLVNGKGTWSVNTPGSVIVNRAYSDMAVTCKHDKWPDGTATVKSLTKGLAYGNVILGGAIGVGVDVATGAAYDYPILLTIEMGQSRLLPVAEPNVMGTFKKME